MKLYSFQGLFCCARKDRQEVAYRSKRKDTEKGRLLGSVKDGWVERKRMDAERWRGRKERAEREKEQGRKKEKKKEREKARQTPGARRNGRKKIKQIGMQHTTTGGWNEGGVKLGQLGVPAPGERVGSILSLSLVFSSTCRHVHWRASA